MRIVVCVGDMGFVTCICAAARGAQTQQSLQVLPEPQLSPVRNAEWLHPAAAFTTRSLLAGRAHKGPGRGPRSPEGVARWEEKRGRGVGRSTHAPSAVCVALGGQGWTQGSAPACPAGPQGPSAAAAPLSRVSPSPRAPSCAQPHASTAPQPAQASQQCRHVPMHTASLKACCQGQLGMGRRSDRARAGAQSLELGQRRENF